MTAFSATTLNLKNDLLWEQFKDDLRQGIRGQDVVFLQEVQNRDLGKALKDLGQDGDWIICQADKGHSQRRQAILLWRATMRRTWMAVTLLHTSRLFPSATRHLLKVNARHLPSGRKMRLANVHLVPHADGGKRDPRGRITTKPRRDLVMRSLRILANWFRRSKAISVAAGDFNSDLRADLRKGGGISEVLNRAGAIAPAQVMGMPRVSTHGKNFYDQFWVRLHGKARMASHRVLPKGFSDHRGYRLRLVIHPRRRR